MADTGSPWNLPYPLDTDLVIDGAQAIEDLAEDVASALTLTKSASNITSGTLDAARIPSGVGGLVASEFRILQAAQTATVAPGGVGLAVSGLSITHAMSDASNKLLFFVQVTGGATDGDSGKRDYVACGLRVDSSSTLVTPGTYSGHDVDASVSQNSASRHYTSGAQAFIEYSPGDTSSHTYTARALKDGSTSTLYINRSRDPLTNRGFNTTSSLLMLEVSV